MTMKTAPAPPCLGDLLGLVRTIIDRLTEREKERSQ